MWFRCTVQQTALRRMMLDMFAYCPNAPPCMMTPPPTERHVTGYTEQQVRDMLPTTELVDNFIGDVMMLAGSDTPASVSACSHLIEILFLTLQLSTRLVTDHAGNDVYSLCLL